MNLKKVSRRLLPSMQKVREQKQSQAKCLLSCMRAHGAVLRLALKIKIKLFFLQHILLEVFSLQTERIVPDHTQLQTTFDCGKREQFVRQIRQQEMKCKRIMRKIEDGLK